MNKKHLIMASALLSVILISGMAQAKTEPAPATTATKTTQASPDKAAVPMRRMMPNLSEAGQKLLQESMKQERESDKATFEEMQTKIKELGEILKAATFDKAAYLSKEQEIQALHAKMMTSRSESFASAVEQMTAEDRAQLANRHHPHKHSGMGSPRGMMKDGKGSMMPMDGATKEGAAQ